MSKKTVRILLIEDDLMAVMAESIVLKELDCQFDVAKTGKDALALIKKNPYDLILCDLGLPDTTGFDVARKTRKEGGINKDTPIFALTAHEDEEHRKRALASGMTDRLKKPLQIEALKKIIESIQD